MSSPKYQPNFAHHTNHSSHCYVKVSAVNKLTMKCMMIMIVLLMLTITPTNGTRTRDTKQQLVGGVATSGGPQALLEPATDLNVEEEMAAEMAAAAAWAESPANTQPTTAAIEGALNVVQTNNVVAARLRQRIQRTRQASKLVSAAAAKRAASTSSTQSVPSVQQSNSVPVAPSMIHRPKTNAALPNGDVTKSTNVKTALKSANSKTAVKKVTAATATTVGSKTAVRVASNGVQASGVKVKGVAGVDLSNIQTTNQQQSSNTVANNLPMTAQLIDGLFDSAIH